mgnify:FL=1
MDKKPHTEGTTGFGFLLLITFVILLLASMGCSSTGAKEVRVDQTDERNAVRTAAPETLRVETVRTDTMWMPGLTITTPETVRVAAEKPASADTADSFPLQRLSVDSAQVQIDGLTESYTLSSPCFGQRLTADAQGGELSFYVRGECLPRDTVVRVEYEKPSFFERKINTASRWIAALAGLAILAYLLRGTLVAIVRSALPW